MLVGMVLLLTACTDDKPEADPPPSPPAIATPTPVVVEPPNDHDLGAALPNSVQIGRIGDYTSCVSGVDVCYWPGSIGGSSNPTLSWARAADDSGRWVEVTVSRQEDPMLRRRFVADVKVLCPRGDWSQPADPRGFHPRPPTEGTSQRLPIEGAGFRGLRCIMETGVLGAERHEEHWIRVVRGDVQLGVSASSEELVLSQFEEYVDRLGWS